MSNGEPKQRILLVGGCGYIGSYLYGRLTQAGFAVKVCDLLNRGNPLGIPVLARDYATLGEDLLRQSDVVLWFAGHSSVAQSILDPQGAIANNCLNLFSFAKKLPPHTKFIYASTGSLYSSKGSVVPATEDSLASIPSQNAYDISKFAFDYLAGNFLERFYALRMGTLAGFSPNLRRELVFNAMNLSAVETGRVRVMNRHASRTILFLSDLWRFIERLIETDAPSGFYNAGSLTATIGELAEAIAATWGVRVVDEGDSQTYSFILDFGRMRAICPTGLQHADISHYSREFIEQVRTSKTQ